MEVSPPGGRPSAEQPAERLTAVLFVDIADATGLAVALGDAAWAKLLEDYHRVVRAGLERHRGWLMDTAGDGSYAIFDEAVDAVRCALDIRSTTGSLGLELRSGVHVGHCWLADAKCAGADVHVGARLASAAVPGEVLVSEEVTDNVRDANIAFADRGIRSLKGLPGTRRVFAVRSPTPGAGARRG
jgi:class 3 adenylate cyclase